MTKAPSTGWANFMRAQPTGPAGEPVAVEPSVAAGTEPFLGSRRAQSCVIDLADGNIVLDVKHDDDTRQSIVMTPEVAFFLREYLSVALRSASDTDQR